MGRKKRGRQEPRPHPDLVTDEAPGESAPDPPGPASDPAPGSPARYRLLAADGVAALLLLAFGVMKAYALAPALSDENIYFYMCHRIAEGALPYRDFFFAHPPFHLIPGALLMALAGFSLPLAKAIPAAAAALAGLAVYRAARRCGPLAAVAALVLFLFAYDLLRASSHYTGASEATALLAWALERSLAGRPRSAGLLAASAGLTAFYAIPAGVALLVWIALRKGSGPLRPDMGQQKSRAGVGEERHRAALDYALTYAALFAAVNLICLALFRSGYWDPVFRYHLMKPPGGEGNLSSVLRGLTRENPWLLWSGPAALAGLFMAWRREAGRVRGRGPLARAGDLLRDPIWGPALAGLLTATLHLGFFSILTRVYTFYALPAFPALALAGGVAYASSLRTIGEWIRPWLARLKSAAGGLIQVASPAGRQHSSTNIRLATPAGSTAGTHEESGDSRPGEEVQARHRARRERSRVRPDSLGQMSAGVLLVAVPFMLPALLPLQGIDAEEGEVLRRYTWRDAPLPGWMNGLVRGLLWSDERVAGAWNPALTRYLWHESRHFTAPAALAARVLELTREGSTVFGDSIAAPLVALLAERRITLDQADTNTMRYRSRITPPEAAIADLEREPPAAIIGNSRRGFLLVPEMQAWVTSRYAVAASVDDPIYGRYDLYLPAGAGPPGAVRGVSRRPPRHTPSLPGAYLGYPSARHESRIRTCGGDTEESMTFRVEIEQEEDGRWIAEVLELPGVMAYGPSADEARAKVQALALRVVAEQLEHGEADSELIKITFNAA